MLKLRASHAPIWSKCPASISLPRFESSDNSAALEGNAVHLLAFRQAQGNFVNHNDGFYTTQVVLTEEITEVSPGETDELEFQGVIQDNQGRQLERKPRFNVTNTAP